jgi:ATP-dependent RNA helicase SUPV3L1/SUV3
MNKTLTTPQLSQIFDIPNKKIISILEKYSVGYKEKRNMNYGFTYLWNVEMINDECFNELNQKKNTDQTIEQIYDFFKQQELVEKHNKELKTKRLKQEELKRELKDQERYINRLEREKTKKEKQEEKTQKLIKKTSEVIDPITQEIYSMWFNNNSTEYIINVGPTNSGKTHKAVDELMKSGDGVYLSPLRLLAFENYEKINELGYPCDLFTGEDKVINGSSLSSRTTEMMDYKNEYDVVILDECFLIGDVNRGKSWLKVILEAKCRKMYLITSNEGLYILEEILTKLNRRYTINQFTRLTPLTFSDKKYNIKKIKPKTVFITFSRVDVLLQKATLEEKGHNVSVLYGNLPPEVKKQQIKKFINGETDVCVSTDVIGMGVNLPCDNVCFLNNRKFDGVEVRELTSTEIKQIGGRAGRYGFSEEGTIYCYGFSSSSFIKKFNDPAEDIKRAYLPINIDIVSKLPQNTLHGKLSFYEKLDLTPDELKHIISPEQTDTYLELLGKNQTLEKLEIHTAWRLLNLPVTESSLNYWSMITERVYSELPVVYRPSKITKPKDTYQLKSVEDELKRVDLFLNFTNIYEFQHLVTQDNIEMIKGYKNELINSITDFLLDKKLSNKKLCITCGKNVGLSWQHKECNSCFKAGRFNYFDFNDNDDYL